VTGTVTLALAACAGGTSSATPPSVQASAAAGSTSAPAGTSPAAHPTETNPPGDIPDQQVFVTYSPPAGHVSVKVPEGWARTQTGNEVRFTDKLNAISILVRPTPSAPTNATVTSTVIPQLAGQVPSFAPGTVSTVTRPAGPAVLVTYLGDSAPDPVTNKVVRDAFERYSFWHAGSELVLTLSGPQNADNVDPWKIVTDSVRWQ
jgi:hypothetical protein